MTTREISRRIKIILRVNTITLSGEPFVKITNGSTLISLKSVYKITLISDKEIGINFADNHLYHTVSI